MPIIISQDDSIYTNGVSVTDAPAFRITGNRIRFVNSESGRAITSDPAIAAIQIEGQDAVVVNEAGGVIRAANSSLDALVIAGGAGADRVENAGTILGRVALGGGNDAFVSRVVGNLFETRVELGDGDDVFYLRPTSSINLSPRVDGGDGIDRLVIFEANGNAGGSGVSNVEILDLRVNGFVESFFDLDTIVADFRPDDHIFSGLRFFNTPDAAVQILSDGGFGNIQIYDRSSIGSLTGSAYSDTVTMGSDTLVTGAIDLGGGDDTISFFRSQFEATLKSLFGTSLDGGAGNDTISVQLRGGDVFDAGNAINFERLVVVLNETSAATLTVRNVDTVADFIVRAFRAVPVLLESSNLSAGRITVEPIGSLTIAADSIAGSVISLTPFPLDTPVADDSKSISIVNHGQILGEVRLYIGDDLLDSRTGTVGGPIFGYAGNDTIMTGAGDDWLDGGAGADLLSGGQDNDRMFGGSSTDRLQGGAGADLLDGGAGADLLEGGAGDDSYFVDNLGDQAVEAAGEGYDIVYAAASYALYAGQRIEVLGTVDNTAATAINLTGNELDNYLVGNAGANTLDGGGGADQLWGRGGDDSYYVDSNDAVVEYAGDGYDVVYARTSYALGVGMAVEVLGTVDNNATTAMNLVGNAFANYIVGNAGANTLDGGGGADQLWGREGDDSYFADADDVVIEYAGQGYDVLYARASYALVAGLSIEMLATANNLATTAINLTGNELDNFVTGNAGSNLLDGGLGADSLQGRGGNDSFAFTTALGGGNIDAILDFVSNSDKVALDDAIFAGIGTPGSFNANAFFAGTAAHDTDDRIIYDRAAGKLYYDADGSGAGAQILFAIVSGAPVIAASDFQVI